MSSFQIIVGSMLGGTEYVAESCEEQLLALNHQVNLHLNPSFSSILAATIDEKTNKSDTWIICTSTHGAGELPDNIQAFAHDLENCVQDLSSINFMILAIGDSNYDTFCKAGLTINNILISKGCTQKTVIRMIDMRDDLDPEDLAKEWIMENKDLL